MNRNRKSIAARFAAAALAGLALAPAALAQDHAHGIPTFSYEAREGTFVGPQELPAGLVQLTLDNVDAAPHAMVLARMNDGVTFEQLQAALQEGGPEAGLPLVTLAGGFGPTMPGSQAIITFDLRDAGSYVALDTMSAALVPLTVVATGDAAPQRPQADLVVQMLDFGYDIPVQVSAGKQVWEVVNHGQEPHELLIFRLQPGVTVEEVLKMAEENPEGEPPMDMVGGVMPMANLYANFVEVDLEPGEYVAWCFIPSPANGGAPHFALGMARPFTVVEQTAAN